MMSRGARTPPEVPEPNETDQTKALSEKETEQGSPDNLSPEQTMDEFVTYAQNTGIKPSADADDDCAEGRPPHPVNRQFQECVLKKVNHAREQPGGEPDNDSYAKGSQDNCHSESNRELALERSAPHPTMAPARARRQRTLPPPG